jgi:hypothetical protein
MVSALVNLLQHTGEFNEDGFVDNDGTDHPDDGHLCE